MVVSHSWDPLHRVSGVALTKRIETTIHRSYVTFTAPWIRPRGRISEKPNHCFGFVSSLQTQMLQKPDKSIVWASPLVLNYDVKGRLTRCYNHTDFRHCGRDRPAFEFFAMNSLRDFPNSLETVCWVWERNLWLNQQRSSIFLLHRASAERSETEQERIVFHRG